MEDTTVSIIGIIIASIMMFMVPLILIADRSDDIAQLVVQTTTSEFVNEVIKSGKITNDSYQKFVNELTSSGNTYEIDMEIKVLDKNTTKIGDNNTYYSIFTSQIEDIMGLSGTNTTNNSDGKIILKQGDAISVTVKNSSKTLSQSLKSFYYNIAGSDIEIITATASGTIAINGMR
ncbi:MAG: hypothetical protein IJE68_01735 [Clostridia bacterium]|nr:hypothetical protein [Clostridia bacterium]